MDYYDQTPKACPFVEGRPLRYSVGWYRGRKRVVSAWFADKQAALCWLNLAKAGYPHLKFDLLESLF